MNTARLQASRQLRAGLSRPAQRSLLPLSPRIQSRYFAAEGEVRYQKGDKTPAWPIYLIGGLVAIMVPFRYILYSNKEAASEHQHSGSSGVGPAGAPDHKDKHRDKRDTPNKGTR